MSEMPLPTKEEVAAYLRDRRNWGRWGDDDQVGAVNLITPEKCAAAAQLVRKGRKVSLSRYIPKTPNPENPMPANHWMRKREREYGAGGCQDYIGVFYHGTAATHLDALCHVWDRDGMWNGKDPDKEVTYEGANFGAVDAWGDGIITRGVFLDIPRHRGEPYVTQDKPVHGWELEEIVNAQGSSLEPGDAIVVYSGREAYDEAHPGRPWGTTGAASRPGLHASCIPFIRENDVAVLGWDMMDLMPTGYELPRTIHAVISSFGLALLDNADLKPLSQACVDEQRNEFMLIIAPLKTAGGTGSPVNPIAMF